MVATLSLPASIVVSLPARRGASFGAGVSIAAVPEVAVELTVRDLRWCRDNELSADRSGEIEA